MSRAAITAMFSVLLCASALAQPQGTGKLYTPGSFEKLEIDGSAQVRLTQGDRDQVFVEGDDKTQDSVEVSLSGNRLEIHPNGGWKFWNSQRLRVDIQLRKLSQLNLSGASDLHAVGPIKADKLTISISGAGEARFDQIDADVLRFDISGAGEGTLAGSAADLGISISGKGRLTAPALRTAKANVSISGVGNATLWVTERLNVNISGIGKVEYWGQPQVRKQADGLGSVNALGDKR